MQSIYQTLEALETACESEMDLRAFRMPELNDAIAAIKALPESEQEEVRMRLDRIGTIIEGQMIGYTEQLEALGGQIRNLRVTSAAAQAYRSVAFIPVTRNEP